MRLTKLRELPTNVPADQVPTEAEPQVTFTTSAGAQWTKC